MRGGEGETTHKRGGKGDRQMCSRFPQRCWERESERIDEQCMFLWTDEWCMLCQGWFVIIILLIIMVLCDGGDGLAGTWPLSNHGWDHMFVLHKNNVQVIH